MSIAQTETNGHPASGWDGPDLDLAQRYPDSRGSDQQQAARAIFGEHAPDPSANATAVEVAQAALRYQDADELRRVKAPDELAADIEQLRRHRAADRQQDDLDHQEAIRRREVERSDAAKEWEQQRAHSRKLAKEQREYEVAKRSAEHLRDRLVDPVNDLVKLRFARRTAPWFNVVPGVLATIAGSVNVGNEVVRATGWTGGWAAAAYGIEAVFTLPLIGIFIAKMCGVATAVTKLSEIRERWSTDNYLHAEAVFVSLALALNVGTHFLPSAPGQPAGNPAAALPFVFVPIGLALSLWIAPMLVHRITERFAMAAREAQLSAPAGPFDGMDAKVLRLARWVADRDAQGLLQSDRDEHGMPSVTKISKAVREHYGSCSKPVARSVYQAYAAWRIMSGPSD